MKILLAALVITGSALQADVFLVRDHHPEAEIVIARDPVRMTRLAATELQTYIEKMTGSRLPIVDQPSGEAIPIYVGLSDYTERLGLSVDGLRHGAFRMVSGPDWLALFGPDEDFVPIAPYAHSRTSGSGGRSELRRLNAAWDEITGDTFSNPFHSLYMWYRPELGIWEFDDRGTLHAVHAFLHDLGVRWYLPGEVGEVIPRHASIMLPAEDRTAVPDFPVRRLSWFYQPLPIAEDDSLWRLRLGLNPGHDVVGITQTVHGMKYVHQRAEMKERHPEFYALWDGKRATDHKGVQGAPCLSSEELLAKHVAYLRAVFDHYAEPMISIDMVDGYSRGVCQCDLCRDLATPERGWAGAMSDYVWGYINRVATELYKSHPDRMVSGITYGGYRLPPTNIEQMSPNLAIFTIPPRTSYDPQMWDDYWQQLAAWQERLPSGEIYTFGNILYNWNRLVPVYFPRRMAGHLRSLKGVSSGWQIECYEHIPGSDHDWDAMAVPHLDLYVSARFMWDVDQDIDALLEEYYSLFYGPARDEMKAFIEYCEVHWPDMVSTPSRGQAAVSGPRGDAAKVSRALELLAAAREAAPDDSVYADRINLVVGYVKPMHDLLSQLQRARVDVPRQRLLPWPALAGKQLDGDLSNDDIWRSNVRLMSLWDNVKGSPHRGTGGTESRVQVFWAGGAVYFGIRCGEPDMENLNPGVEVDGTLDIRQGDFVEIYIETSTHSYYRITVNPFGEIVDADCSEGEDLRWTSGARAAIKKGEDFWSVELRIPLAGDSARLMDPLAGMDGRLPTAAMPWHFNVVRQRVRGDQVDRMAYSPTGMDDFAVPERFAELWGSSDLK